MTYEVQTKPSASAIWNAAEGVGDVLTYQMTLDGAFDIRVRAVSDEGVRGPWSNAVSVSTAETFYLLEAGDFLTEGGNRLTA